MLRYFRFNQRRCGIRRDNRSVAVFAGTVDAFYAVFAATAGDCSDIDTFDAAVAATVGDCRHSKRLMLRLLLLLTIAVISIG